MLFIWDIDEFKASKSESSLANLLLLTTLPSRGLPTMTNASTGNILDSMTLSRGSIFAFSQYSFRHPNRIILFLNIIQYHEWNTILLWHIFDRVLVCPLLIEPVHHSRVPFDAIHKGLSHSDLWSALQKKEYLDIVGRDRASAANAGSYHWAQ